MLPEVGKRSNVQKERKKRGKSINMHKVYVERGMSTAFPIARLLFSFTPVSTEERHVYIGRAASTLARELAPAGQRKGVEPIRRERRQEELESRRTPVLIKSSGIGRHFG